MLFSENLIFFFYPMGNNISLSELRIFFSYDFQRLEYSLILQLIVRENLKLKDKANIIFS